MYADIDTASAIRTTKINQDARFESVKWLDNARATKYSMIEVT